MSHTLSARSETPRTPCPPGAETRLDAPQAGTHERGWRQSLILATLLVAAYLGIGVFDHGIWAPTEPAVAGVVSNMEASGDLSVPRINGFAYLEKPPLYYWLAWLTHRADPHNHSDKIRAGLLRLPAAILGLLSLLSVFWISRRRYGTDIATVATLLTACSGVLYILSHRAAADNAVIFFAALCFALFIRTLPADDAPPSRHADPSQRGATLRDDLLIALVVACSFYAKNFLTYLIVLPPILSYMVWRAQYRRALLFSTAVVILTLVLVAPWAWALHAEGGWLYVRVVFIDNTFGRFLNLHHLASLQQTALNDAYFVHKDEPFYYYLSVLPTLSAPWTLLFIAALGALFRKRRGGEYRFFLKLSFIVVLSALSLSTSKSDNYLDALLIILVLIMADFLHEMSRTASAVPRWERYLFVANLVVVTLGFIGIGLYGWHQFGDTHLLAWSILTLATAGWLVWRFTPLRPNLPVTRIWFGFAAVSWFIMAALVMPHVDAAKSPAHFFQAVREDSAQRPLYTVFVDDRTLPLINFSLDRPLPILPNDAAALALLKGPRSVALLVPADFYTRHRAALAAIPLTHLSWNHKISYLANDPALVQHQTRH